MLPHGPECRHILPHSGRIQHYPLARFTRPINRTQVPGVLRQYARRMQHPYRRWRPRSCVGPLCELGAVEEGDVIWMGGDAVLVEGYNLGWGVGVRNGEAQNTEVWMYFGGEM